MEAVIRFGDLGTGPDEIIGTSFHRAGKVKEIFSGACYPVGKEGLRAKFGPFETKAFLTARPSTGGSSMVKWLHSTSKQTLMSILGTTKDENRL